MSEQEFDIVEAENWKPKVLLIGTALGAVVGLSAAYLLIKSSGDETQPEISAGQGAKLGVLIFGLLRNIASLDE